MKLYNVDLDCPRCGKLHGVYGGLWGGLVIDVAARRLVCVKPYPPFVPLFRMDGLSEKEGCLCRRRRRRS